MFTMEHSDHHYQGRSKTDRTSLTGITSEPQCLSPCAVLCHSHTLHSSLLIAQVCEAVSQIPVPFVLFTSHQQLAVSSQAHSARHQTFAREFRLATTLLSSFDLRL